MNPQPVQKSLYDAILAVLGGAAGGVAFAALTNPLEVTLVATLALVALVGLLAWFMRVNWEID